MQYNIIHHIKMQYNTIIYSLIQYNTIQYNIEQYKTMQYNETQYNTTQYSLNKYNTIQYNTIQYNTITSCIYHCLVYVYTVVYIWWKTADILGELCCDWSVSICNMWNIIWTIQYITVVYCTQTILSNILDIYYCIVLQFTILYM